MNNFEALRARANQASKFIKALSNPDRLLLLCQMTLGEICVSDLESKVGVQQPTLSQQLTVLRLEGVVNARREGKQVYYSIRSPEVLEILKILYTKYCSVEREV